jgi:SAM-dependent methyltransferase
MVRQRAQRTCSVHRRRPTRFQCEVECYPRWSRSNGPSDRRAQHCYIISSMSPRILGPFCSGLPPASPVQLRQEGYPKMGVRSYGADPLSIERAAGQAYEVADYYAPGIHPTSRYFDRLIDQYQGEHALDIKPKSRWLEVGAGRGRLTSYRKDDEWHRVYLDVSRRMIRFVNDSAGDRVLGSAFRCPFRDATFNGVVSFLGDPYNTRDYFREAYRVLVDGGQFIHAVPSAMWALALRDIMNWSPDETYLVNSSGMPIRAPSIVTSDSELRDLCEGAGFSRVAIVPLFAHLIDTPVPLHIELVQRRIQRPLEVLVVAECIK